ncbi:hypothetical protein LX64_01856 [Chitinophaga skermanii]|uniref:Uncharacterized protein n=1 Tax=Chitinophaga skermanii TaxID=331697 RepID=A0A327QQ74_9BACT|nr:hypothetical protein LX64_01856 [Chitinophaga skermanii]
MILFLQYINVIGVDKIIMEMFEKKLHIMKYGIYQSKSTIYTVVLHQNGFII